jgi:hypothetical protein
MRGTVAAGLGGAALVTIVALLVLLPGRLLSSGRISDPVAPAALPELGVVHASVGPSKPVVHVTLPVHALGRRAGAADVHASAVAPRKAARKHVAPRRHAAPKPKPASRPVPAAPHATPVPAVAVPTPAVATTPATPAPAPAPTPRPVPSAPVIAQSAQPAPVAPKPVPAVVPSVSVTVGSGKVESTLVASVRDGSDAESAQYGHAASDQADRTTGGAAGNRADGVRPVAAAAGAATPAVARAWAPARHEDRRDRGQARGREDRVARQVGHGHRR